MNETVKIDWDALPSEAQWVSMDANGKWYWYKEGDRPTIVPGARVWRCYENYEEVYRGDKMKRR